MTEAEWLKATDPTAMLEFLGGKVSDRRLRLVAVACCRRVWDLMPDERCRVAAEVAERVADGMATEPELRAAAEAAFASAQDYIVSQSDQPFAIAQGRLFAAHTSYWCANPASHEAAVRSARTLFLAAVGAAGDLLAARRAASNAVSQCRINLLRDIFGNPFHPITFNSNWRTSDVTAMARGMYETRDFGAMPILADALQDAGCENADVLEHCRGPGPHVRGCWVVDLILGKN